MLASLSLREVFQRLNHSEGGGGNKLHGGMYHNVSGGHIQ